MVILKPYVFPVDVTVAYIPVKDRVMVRIHEWEQMSLLYVI